MSEQKNLQQSTSENTQPQTNSHNFGEDIRNKSYPLFEKTQIEGTPFEHVVSEDGEEFIALGMFIVLKKKDWRDDESLEEALERNKWNIITRMISGFMVRHEQEFHGHS